MSIRVLMLFACVAGLSIYAFKDWFKSLCGLILLMAVIEHQDMPKTMLGIQGLNVWNILFGVIFIAWLMNRRNEALTFNMPRYLKVLLVLYLFIIVTSVVRALLDPGQMPRISLSAMVSEYLINTIKWTLPGILLFDGCNTRKRIIMALVCLLTMYTLVAVQVIRRMPLKAAVEYSESVHRSRLKINRDVGYHACDVSAFLAGASWGLLAILPLMRKMRFQIIVFLALSLVILGQALSGGRAGYVAWGGTFFLLCVLKWRKYLLLLPVMVIMLPVIFPGPTQRMLEGFGGTDITGQKMVDHESVMSGRLKVWPLVVNKIKESPLIGFGRLAMKRTGLTARTDLEFNDPFPHPHNMYLEVLLDNGLLGTIPIFLFWGSALFISIKLFRMNDPLLIAVGGISASLLLAQLIAGVGAQSFYPRESTLGMWAALFISIRCYVEMKKSCIYPYFEHDGTFQTNLITCTRY